MSFGDIRVADRADWLLDRIVTTGSLVLRKLGETRAGEVAIQRFLSSRHVAVDRLVETVAARTAAQCAGRRVLAVQDTTEFNFSGREKRRKGRALTTSLVRVAPRGPGDKGRIAQVELRVAKVSIARPDAYSDRGFPKTVEMTLVEAREVDAPKGKTPLLWRLLTTLEADTAEKACEVVQFYRLRWRIEQTFRALKSDGLALEDSQVTSVEHMFNLAAAGLIAAVRTIQLVDARDGSSRPATDVLDNVFAPALERISKKLEGATQRQKNPHTPNSLAFVAWIAARLGGWNCYGKPPGPKTMRSGWSELAAMLCGYALATQEKIP